MSKEFIDDILDNLISKSAKEVENEIFDEIEISSVMENLWKTYQKNYSYAADISWHTIMKSICTLYGSMLK